MSDMDTRLLRRALFLFLIAVVSVVPLGATAAEHLLLSTGNDAISLGLGNNQDDGRSFSLRGELRGRGGCTMAVELTSHTDQHTSKHRYDTLDFSFAYPYALTLSPSWSLTLTPDVGIKLIGSFGLEEAQTLLHSFKKKKPVVLPVSTDELAVHPGGSLDVTLSYQSRRSRYSLNVATDHRHSWESEVEAALQYQYGPALSAAVGYHYTKGWSGFPSQYMQEERYNGLYFAADYDGNLLFTSYRYYPQSGFSYGYIGFDVLAFSTPKTFQQNDLTITHGLFYELDGSPQRLTAIEVGPAVLSLLYMSGPIDDTHRHNIGEYTLSYHWHLFPHNTFLRPSIEAGAGIKRFNLVQHFDETVLEEVRPALSLEVALGLGPRPLWVVANTAYSVQVGARLTHVFATEGLTTHVDGYDHLTKAWVFLLGITLVVDHDLSEVR